MMKMHIRSIGAVSIFAAGMALSGAGIAVAQDSSQELVNRLNRLQNELTTLQRHVYRGERAPASVATASPAPATAARLSVRITQLEDEIRRLTGVNETLTHQIRQLRERLEKAAADTDLRLKALEGGAKPAVAAGAAAGSTPAQPAPAPDSGSVANADKGARVLGSVRESETPATKPVALTETPEQQYDRAHGLLMKTRDYAGAERVFSDFLSRHPKHALAPNAYYWLGRTYFVREDFQQSVATFATGFKTHPESKKAPATLLNLGMSLSRLGKTREACETFAHLARHFPKAEGAVKRRLATERKTAQCR